MVCYNSPQNEKVFHPLVVVGLFKTVVVVDGKRVWDS